MLNGTATDRAEIRRPAIWFDTTLYAEITARPCSTNGC